LADALEGAAKFIRKNAKKGNDEVIAQRAIYRDIQIASARVVKDSKIR
jgi:hypothetical protein